MTRFSILPALLGMLFTGQVAAKTCEVEITGNDALEFDKSEIVVDADCEEVTLTLKHSGAMSVEQMGHNWTLTTTDNWREVAQAGQAAGRDNNYLPPGDDRVLQHTDLVGGGESTSITFGLSQLDRDTDYTFFCAFPGHWAQMNGKFIIR